MDRRVAAPFPPPPAGYAEGPLRFATLEGSAEDRGRTLSQLLGPEVERCHRLFSSLCGRMMRLSVPGMPLLAAPLVDRALLATIGRRLVGQLDPETRAVVRAATRQLAGPADAYLRAHVSLDLLLLFAALARHLRLAPTVAACSGLVAFGPGSKSGGLYFGRNFDLPVYRPDSPPTWLVLERPPGGLSHLSVYPLPGYSPGVTAINEAGLCVGILMDFSLSIAPDGQPILAIARRVIEKARSVDEGESLLRQMRPAAGWTFMLADASGARLVEISPRGVGVVPAERGILFAANRFRSLQLKGSDFAAGSAFREHNEAREARLLAASEALRGRLDAVTIAGLLGDTTDPTTGARRAFGPCISACDNTDSVVFAPNDDRLWIATAGWPANAGHYVGLKLSSLFAGRVEQEGELSANRVGDSQSAIQAYVAACYQLIVEGDDAAAERELDRAVRADGDEPSFRAARGTLRLRRGESKLAESDLRAALTRETWPGRRVYASLLLGHALDLQGARSAALRAYDDANRADVDVAIAQAARRGLRRPFRRWESKFLPFDPLMAHRA